MEGVFTYGGGAYLWMCTYGRMCAYGRGVYLWKGCVPMEACAPMQWVCANMKGCLPKGVPIKRTSHCISLQQPVGTCNHPPRTEHGISPAEILIVYRQQLILLY